MISGRHAHRSAGVRTWRPCVVHGDVKNTPVKPGSIGPDQPEAPASAVSKVPAARSGVLTPAARRCALAATVHQHLGLE